MINYEKIQKECFWEYNFDKKEIQEIVDSNDFQKKKFLFDSREELEKEIEKISAQFL